MPYKVTIDGFEVSCDTADELMDAIGRAGARRRSTTIRYLEGGGVRAPLVPPPDTEPLPMTAQAQVALQFLEVIRDSKGPAMVDEFVDNLKLAGPKGVGGISGTVNRVLERIGFNPPDVYDNRRTTRGREWMKGPALSMAIERLRMVIHNPELATILDK